MSVLLLVAMSCARPEPKPASPEPSETTSSPTGSPSETSTADTSTADTSTASPTSDGCLPEVGALLFDLGETLVTEQGGVFVLRPDTVEAVLALKDLGIPLGIVTNTYPSWTEQDLRNILQNPELLDAFDVVLLSSEAASPPKPDPAIFVEAHDLLPNAPPLERTAFVTEETGDLADRAEEPTEGARAAGLVGVLLSDTPSPKADHTVGALTEIPVASWLGCGR